MTQVQNILDVRGVSKTFTLASGIFRRDSGVVRALDDVSFSVPAGSTVGLVGESGCGKSTMGHVIMGGLRADAGEIAFADPDRGKVNLVVKKGPDGRMQLEKRAVVPQSDEQKKIIEEIK